MTRIGAGTAGRGSAGARGRIAVVMVALLALGGVAVAGDNGRATAAFAAPKPGDAGALKDRKKQIDAQVAAAGETYEAAGRQMQAAAEAYTRATAELPDAQSALDTANGSVIAASVAYDTATTRVATATAAATAAEAAVSGADEAVDAARAKMSAILAASYEGTQLVQVDAVMNADTPGGLLDQMSYLDLMFAHQKQALTGLVATRQQADEARNGAVVAQRAALDAQRGAAAALADRQAALTRAQQAERQVTALVAQRSAALAVARKNRQATLDEYRKLQQLSDQVEKQLAALAGRQRHQGAKGGSKGTGGGTVTSMTGYFIMPVHGWESSPFGLRFDPFYKRWQLHAGVDIAAAGGTPIRAAAAGRVVRAGWAGGYGNYTCISHGIYTGPGQYHDRGIATCYGHQSRILVRVGQRVGRGQVIGRVGETGAATGYHLHFEVRIDGRPIQPVTWLPHCWC